MSKLKNFFASPNGLIALYTVALVALWLLIRFIAGSFNKIVEFFKNGKLKVDPFMNGVRYPVSYWTEKGGRPYQEDRFHVMKGGSEASLYGVFDGHGGFRAAQFCKEFLLQTIGTDPDLNTSPPMAIHRSFLKVDEEFSSKARHRMLTDGTTAVIAAIHNGRIYVGNAGDSRAILIRKDGRVQMMSQDHRPDRKDEENRIRRLGGKLLYYGSWRVEGVLAVSRAIGDVNLQPYITAEPEIMDKTIEPDDEYLVIATDGIWDVLENEEVAKLVLSHNPKDFLSISKKICMQALQLGSADNVTALVVDIKQRLSSSSDSKNSKSKSN